MTEPLDLARFRDGSTADRAACAAELDRMCRDTGFLHVVGHGVDPQLLIDVLDVCGEFFDLPTAEKERHVDPVLTNNRGYTGVGTEALAYSLDAEVVAPDLFEAFNVGREDTEGPAFDAHRRFYAPNVWPDTPTEFRSVVTRYMDALRDVNDTLMRIFAEALGLHTEHLVDRTRRAIITLRAINYERRHGEAPARPGQQRMGAHTDYGVLTVLLADDVPGLEIERDGRWEPVPIVAGGFVVNLGDMLARWTNDRWVSTMHRVVPPPTDAGRVRRRSIAQFLEADPECMIECFPTCLAPGEEPRYEPVEAGEYLLAKLMGPREMRPSAIE